MAIVACGARTGLPIPEDQTGSSSSAGGSSTTSSSSSSASTTSATTTSSTGGPLCAPDALLVYVFSQENEIYRFNPPAKTFDPVVALNCPVAPGQIPNSMAVDREGIAWVDYYDFNGGTGAPDAQHGAIYRVNLMDGSCQASGLTLPSQWQWVGMGYALDPTSKTGETLFLTSSAGELGRVDFDAMTIDSIGTFPAPYNGFQSELTGTGDGRLFTFVSSQKPVIGNVDKTTAGILGIYDVSSAINPFADFAFSFWGGVFYLYTSATAGGGSSVAKFDPADGSIDANYVPDVGFSIVGAGVAPCAATLPP